MKSRILKGTLIALAALAQIALIRLACLHVSDWQYARSFTPERVELHCGQAVTTRLKCWCYDQLYRTCPEEAE